LKVFWLALGSTQPPIQCILVSLVIGVRHPGREAADHPLLPNFEVKKVWSLTSTPTHAFIVCTGKNLLYCYDVFVNIHSKIPLIWHRIILESS